MGMWWKGMFLWGFLVELNTPLTAGVKGGRKIQCLEESSRIEGKFEICHLTLMFPRSMINVHLPFYISEKNLNYFSHHENLKIRERKRLRSHTTYSSSFSVASSQPFQAVARNKIYVSCSDVWTTRAYLSQEINSY